MDKKELIETIQKALAIKRQEKAEELARQAVNTYPDEAFGYAYLAKAILLRLPVPLDKAAYCFAKASQLEPRNIDYLTQFAIIKAKQGEIQNAQLLWGKILGMAPNNLTALIYRGTYFLEDTKDYKRALLIFNQAIQYHSNNAELYCYRAVTYLRSKQYEEALNDYNSFIEFNNGEEDVKNLLVKIQILKGLNQIENIVETYKQLVNIDPMNYMHHTGVADNLVLLERYAEAAEFYEAASILSKHKNDVITYTWGNTLINSEQYEKALQAFGYFVEHSSTPHLGALQQIYIYIQLKKYQNALERITVAQKSCENEESSNKLLLLKSEAFLGLKEYQNALDTLKPIKEKPHSIHYVPALYLSGNALLMLNDKDAAYRFIKYASLKGHQPATELLKEQFQDYLYQLQKNNLELGKKVTDKNATSTFIKKISNKVWQFSSLQGSFFSGWTEEQLKAVVSLYGNSTLFLTPKGYLFLMGENTTLAGYKIAQESAENIEFKTMDLDQMFISEMALKLNSDGKLVYTADKNKEVVFDVVDSNALTNETKTQVQEYIQRRNLELLGPSVKELADAIWS